MASSAIRLVPHSLVEAIQAHLLERFGWRIEEEWLVWLPSVVPGLDLTCRAFAADGEAVLALTPVYPPFLAAPRDQGRRLVTVPVTPPGGPGATPPARLGPLSDAPTADVSSQPPTGACRSKSSRRPSPPTRASCSSATRTTRSAACGDRTRSRRVVELCRRHDLVLCSDEIHADLVLDDLRHVPLLLAHPDAAARP